jgi:hypothetical protein
MMYIICPLRIYIYIYIYVSKYAFSSGWPRFKAKTCRSNTANIKLCSKLVTESSVYTLFNLCSNCLHLLSDLVASRYKSSEANVKFVWLRWRSAQFVKLKWRTHVFRETVCPSEKVNETQAKSVLRYGVHHLHCLITYWHSLIDISSSLRPAALNRGMVFEEKRHWLFVTLQRPRKNHESF